MDRIYGNLQKPAHERRARAMQLFCAAHRYTITHLHPTIPECSDNTMRPRLCAAYCSCREHRDLQDGLARQLEMREGDKTLQESLALRRRRLAAETIRGQRWGGSPGCATPCGGGAPLGSPLRPNLRARGPGSAPRAGLRARPSVSCTAIK
jgi:hypothetical protein